MEKTKAQSANAGLNDDIILRIVTGVPSRAKALIEKAQKTDCGSIIVGRRGISQVEDFNIGRVCQKVLHRAKDIAVWIVPWRETFRIIRAKCPKNGRRGKTHIFRRSHLILA